MDDFLNGTEPNVLFAYGTLGPVDAVDAGRHGWTADAVRGRLYDLGPYPLLIDWDDPGAGWVEGHVRSVDSIELREVLDPYEGVEDGEFLRVVVRTRRGQAVWIYVYPHAVPEGAVGPLPRWEGPRIHLNWGNGR